MSVTKQPPLGAKATPNGLLKPPSAGLPLLSAVPAPLPFASATVKVTVRYANGSAMTTLAPSRNTPSGSTKAPDPLLVVLPRKVVPTLLQCTSAGAPPSSAIQSPPLPSLDSARG